MHMLLFVADHLEVDPLPYLLGVIFASNIGGAASPDRRSPRTS